MAVGRHKAEGASMAEIAVVPFAPNPVLQQERDHGLKNVRASCAECQVPETGLRRGGQFQGVACVVSPSPQVDARSGASALVQAHDVFEERHTLLELRSEKFNVPNV